MDPDVEVTEEVVVPTTPLESVEKVLHVIDVVMSETDTLVEEVSKGITLSEASVLVSRFWHTPHLKESILLKLSSNPLHNSNVLLTTPFEEKAVVKSFTALQVVEECVQQVKKDLPGFLAHGLDVTSEYTNTYKKVVHGFGEVSSECLMGSRASMLQDKLLNDSDVTLTELVELCCLDMGDHVLEDDYVDRINKQTGATWVSNYFKPNTLNKAVDNILELKVKVILLKLLLEHVITV